MNGSYEQLPVEFASMEEEMKALSQTLFPSLLYQLLEFTDVDQFFFFEFPIIYIYIDQKTKKNIYIY